MIKYIFILCLVLFTCNLIKLQHKLNNLYEDAGINHFSQSTPAENHDQTQVSNQQEDHAVDQQTHQAWGGRRSNYSFGNSTYGGRYRNSSSRRPIFGNSGYRPTTYGNSSFGRPSFGGSSLGRPTFGGSSFGNPSYARPNYGNGNGYGRPNYGNSSYGRPSYGNFSNGRPMYGNFSNGNSSRPFGWSKLW